MQALKFKTVWVLAGFFYFFTWNVFSQDQKVADSLKLIYDPAAPVDSVKLEILRNLAFNELNNLDEALRYAETLIGISEDQGLPLYVHRGYLQKGRINRLKGNLNVAIEALFKSNEAAESIGYVEGQGASYLSIADIYSVSGNSSNARNYYNEAIRLLRSANDSIILATALINTGDEYMNVGKFDSALIFFQESGEIFERMAYKVGLAYNLGNIGMVYASTGRNDLAEDNINKAVTILEEVEDYYPISVYLTYMADIFLEKGDVLSARNYAMRSLELAEKYGLKEQISGANLKLSELYEQTGDFEASLSYYKAYIEYRDSVRNIETVQQMADLRTDFEVSRKQIEVDLLNQQKRTQQAIGIGLIVILGLSGVLVVVLYKNNERRKRTNAELEQLNKTKDKFFSIISHDLRGPVSSFQGISQIIRMYIKRKSFKDLEEMTDQIDQSTSSISHLLDNLLNWAVQQRGGFPYKPESIRVADLFDTVENTYKTAMRGKRIKLEHEMSESELSIWGDSNSVRTILRNLTGNAIKFSPENGTILLSAKRDNGQVLIEVTDTGVGIPREKVEDLFSFRDRKSTYGTSGEKGIGLGLQLVYEFVQLNKGSISVRSTEGEGTTFTCRFPAEAPRENPQVL